ncbi:MAG: hypothetical protein LBS31_10985 [Candidatus Adiutrix sp.]|jgi:hypothetical protein|nr:hypothetical protein [Candidatus Adiutrix sp.]
MPVLLMAGAAVLVLGAILFFVWIAHFLALIKALAPLAIMAGGAVMVCLGRERMRDRQEAPLDFSSPDEASRYKAEAKAYQAEINVVASEGEIMPPEGGSPAEAEAPVGGETRTEQINDETKM